MEESKKRNNTSTILGILLGIAIVAAGYFGYTTNEKNKQEQVMALEMDSLMMVRQGLETDLDRLSKEYEDIAIENDSLKGSLDNAREVIAKKEDQIRWAQRKAATDSKTLKEEIVTLEAARSGLTSTIEALRTENNDLKQANAELTEKVALFEEENAGLQVQVTDLNAANSILEKKAADLANTSFKASSMQVDIAKRNDKNTIKSRRVRKLNIGFDLVDVPEEFQGAQNIYLYITDSNGVPIEGGSGTVKVGSGDKSLVIEPIDVKKVSLTGSQRFEFTHEIIGKLKPGYYIASIYADKGLLGSTLFKLI
ncbi:MAG: hypothetical protein OEQ53_00975 [Saprospiraceae bacterium]|nr:hypothetical protein [Saprospiraceae bacterium]